MKIIATPTCHYLFPDNHYCGSPSLRGEAFCFFHHPNRQPAATVPKSTVARPPKRGTFASKCPECKHFQCHFPTRAEVLCPLTATP
jgi:hypothetical protein